MVQEFKTIITNIEGLKLSKRKCGYCSERKDKSVMFITPLQAFCNRDHAAKYAFENKHKGADKVRKEFDKETARRKKKFRDTDLSHQLKLTQDSFNKLRRLEEFKWFSDRGIKPYCISCGKENMDWCCGHYKTVGSRGDLRFSRINTKLQCNRDCNKGRSGNINGNHYSKGYTQGLIDRFGEELSNRMFSCIERVRLKKWHCDELISLRKEFNRQIRELEE